MTKQIAADTYYAQKRPQIAQLGKLCGPTVVIHAFDDLEVLFGQDATGQMHIYSHQYGSIVSASHRCVRDALNLVQRIQVLHGCKRVVTSIADGVLKNSTTLVRLDHNKEDSVERLLLFLVLALIFDGTVVIHQYLPMFVQCRNSGDPLQYRRQYGICMEEGYARMTDEEEMRIIMAAFDKPEWSRVVYALLPELVNTVEKYPKRGKVVIPLPAKGVTRIGA